MQKIFIRLALAGAIVAGAITTSAAPAEARSGRFVAGVLVGAVVGGLIAREVYREKRRRHYAYYPRYHSGYSYYRPSRHYYGW